MKLKLTKAEIAAVKASIKHWQRDIQKPLKAGRKIKGGTGKTLGNPKRLC